MWSRRVTGRSSPACPSATSFHAAYCSPMLAGARPMAPRTVRQKRSDASRSGTQSPTWSNMARDYATSGGFGRERLRPLATGPGAGREQRGGRQAGKAAALAREVRLVRVPGGERERREVVLDVRGEREEALEAQDALERLRAVADGVDEAAAQLALADPEAGAQRLDRRA